MRIPRMKIFQTAAVEVGEVEKDLEFLAFPTCFLSSPPCIAEPNLYSTVLLPHLDRSAAEKKEH